MMFMPFGHGLCAFLTQVSAYGALAWSRVGGMVRILGAAAAVTARACAQRQRNIDHREKDAGAPYRMVPGGVSTPR
jgi:hypothetical protein